MGNSNGGFDEYWRVFRSGTRARGGAIWDWVDQGHRMPVPPRLTVRDRSPSAVDALFVGTVAPGEGGEGYLSLPDVAALDLRDAVTLEATILPRRPLMGAAYPSVARIQPYVSRGDLGFQLIQLEQDLQLSLRLEGAAQPWIVKAPVPQDWYGQWHRVTGSYDGARAALYVDGHIVAEDRRAGRLSPGHFPVNVGRNPERIDIRAPARFREVRVYSRALGPSEVAAATRPDAGLVLWLALEDARETAPGGTGHYLAYGGDFGPTTTPSDENFCQNGLVSADRTPHPGLGEVAHAQRYVRVALVDRVQGRIAVTNDFDFTALSDVAVARYEVRADDRVLARGTLPRLDLAPHETRDVTVPLPTLPAAPGVEYWLDVVFSLAADTSWASAGHVLAHEQLALAASAPAVPIDVGTLPAVSVTESGGRVLVRARGVTYGFDPRTGLLVSMRAGDRELLAGPLRPDFWRAPVDNDRGSDMMKRLGEWRDAHASFVVQRWTVRRDGPGVVNLEATGELEGRGVSYGVAYTVFGDGRLLVEPSMTAGAARPDLPRFGMQATLAPGLEQLAWYGPGPEETYADRRDRPVGLYRTTVTANYFRYSQPQETGNKVDVRWAAVTGADGAGLLAIGQPRLSVNALHSAAAEIDQAGHHHQLPAHAETFLNLDLAQMGLGGDDSWGALPLPQYRLPAGSYTYRFVLQPIGPGDEPMRLSKVEVR
jgi:beta-galactosidase